MLSEKEIEQLADQLQKDFGGQKTNDTLDKDIIGQRHVVDAQKDTKRQVKAVGTGYGKLVTTQNFSFLSSRPFVAYNAPRDTLKEHAEMLEAATQGMWKLSGAYLAWLRSIRDVVDVGRGWMDICHVPQLWKGLDFQQGEDESDKDYLDRLDDLKLANWPIVARHVDVRNCWVTFTLKREVDQVTEISEMTVRQIKQAYGISYDKKEETDKLKVISYADHENRATVIVDKGRITSDRQFAKTPWEHDMGMNPYVLMEAPPEPENDEGVMWEGSVAALRYLIPEMDGAITDWRHNTKRDTHSETVFSLDLANRRDATPDAKSNADLITRTPDGDIILDLKEGITKLGGSTTNPDIPGVIAAMRSFTQELSIRASLLGMSEHAAESGAEYNTKAQTAQKMFGPAIDFLDVAAENVVKHFVAAIIAFSETFKDIPGLEDDKIPIYFVDSKGISQRRKLSASDVRGWDMRLQAKIDPAIQLNENAMVQTARLYADKKDGLGSVETALERWCQVANPREEMRQRRKEMIVEALDESLIEFVRMRGMQIQSKPATDPSVLAQRYAGLDPQIQAVLQRYAASRGQQLPGVPEARATSNIVRTGAQQQLSKTKAMGGVPGG